MPWTDVMLVVLVTAPVAPVEWEEVDIWPELETFLTVDDVPDLPEGLGMFGRLGSFFRAITPS